MGRSEERLEHAQKRATRARDRLVADLLAIKERLMPSRLFRDLTRKAKVTGTEAVAAGTDAVKARPGIAVGAVALTALFFARKPIIRAFSSKQPETPPAPARSPVKSTTTKRTPTRRTTAPRTRKAKP